MTRIKNPPYYTLIEVLCTDGTISKARCGDYGVYLKQWGNCPISPGIFVKSWRNIGAVLWNSFT